MEKVHKSLNLDKIKNALEKGIADKVYPGAVLLVARGGEIVFHDAVGFRSIIPERLPMERSTIFDLASLTKPLATTLAIMKLVDEGKVNLDQTLEELLPVSIPEDKKLITLRLILCHAAGLSDWQPFYLKLKKVPREKRKETLREWIMKEPMSYEPGKGTLYSDLGFMTLEWVIETKTGMTMPLYLDRYFYNPLSLKRTLFIEDNKTDKFPDYEFAATEDCPWRKKVIQGCIHDDNTFLLGGYSGHAGLFGTAEDVYTIVNMLREHYHGEREDFFRPETIRNFLTRQRIPEESAWALGWDTPDPESSSTGQYFSARSVGHWGFTGTSVWMDLEKDVIVVFLTNRVHPTRDNDSIREFRPQLHDTIMKEIN